MIATICLHNFIENCDKQPQSSITMLLLFRLYTYFINRIYYSYPHIKRVYKMSRYDNDYEDYKDEHQSYWKDNIISKRAVVAEAYNIKNINEIENSIAYGIDITKKVKSAATLMDQALDKKPKRAGLKIKDEYVVVKPFYPEDYLKRCSNAFLFDDVVFSALNRLSFFTFGEGD